MVFKGFRKCLLPQTSIFQNKAIQDSFRALNSRGVSFNLGRKWYFADDWVFIAKKELMEDENFYPLGETVIFYQHARFEQF